MSFTGTNNFINNSAQFGGISKGGAISTYINTLLSFTGTNNFINNLAQSEDFSEGGAIYAYSDTSLSFTGASNFEQNSASISGGAIFARMNCVLSITGISNFSSNSARDTGGAIYLINNNNLIFDGNISFINNGHSANKTQVSYGGGMYLHNSTFCILPATTVNWVNNRASYGGAIYVFDQTNPLSYCSQIDNYINIRCFYQLPDRDLSNNVQLIFRNNTAELKMEMLYIVV